MSDRLEIRYIPLAQCVLWARNPKKHDTGMIAASIETHGFKSAPRYEPALNDGQGGIGAGNGRIQVLEAMQAQGRESPRGIVVEDGVWLVPVQFGVDAASQAAAEAYAIDDNNVTLAGGEFTAVDMSRLWADDYTDLLAELANLDMLPVSVDGDDLDVLLRITGDGTSDVSELWKGMPEFEYTPKAFKSIAVHFAKEEDYEAFARLINQTLTAQTRYIWYPYREKDDLKDFRYEREG